MEYSFLQLTDYNDLYTIAVGLSMAYIWVEARNNNTSEVLPFFNFLRQLGRTLINKVLNKKTRHQQEEEKLATQITYYVESNVLKDETKGALLHIKRKVEGNLLKIKAIENDANEKMQYFTRAEYLHVISFDCFLFGLFLLLLGPIESVQYYNVDKFVVWMNGFMTIALLHCLLCEFLGMKDSWLTPRKLTHAMLFLCSIFAVLFCIPEFDFGNEQWWKAFSLFFSLTMCYIGFIIYTVYSFFACSILFVVYYIKISCLSLAKVEEEYKADLELYRHELDEADGKLKDILESAEFQVNGVPIQTRSR